ncbi:hypothetical protein ES695_02260 [Candidatus Atribacteria bacterium 1244-E10-H5-B2]|nr:MAG: hypothetical protein ES695_02260 [Candidatus Atribacteria bacterium 1244-E10-H5-B2]
MKFLGVLDKPVVNKENSRPKPGDIVYAKNSDNCLIKDGDYGVIESVDDKIVRAGWNITNPYFDEGVCTVSGGPVIGLKAGKVRSTFNKKIITFWRFKGGLAMAHNGEDFAGQVNVFEYDFKS